MSLSDESFDLRENATTVLFTHTAVNNKHFVDIISTV